MTEDNLPKAEDQHCINCNGPIVEATKIVEVTETHWVCCNCNLDVKVPKQKMLDTKLGIVIQIDPEHNLFSGCFALVTETKQWGVQAFVAIPKRRGEFPGEAHVRLRWGDFEIVGESPFKPEFVENSPLILPPSVRPS